jgi:hypothetical protein
MSLRAEQLQETADRQISTLVERLSAAGKPGLVRPCPGREKLGDGTVGAVAAHAADNYHRIARFAGAIPDSGAQNHSGQRSEGYRATQVELDALLARLAAARDALVTIAQLSDEQLDSVPPAGAMKFADGERTLEQIVASLLKHQHHQVDALARGLS